MPRHPVARTASRLLPALAALLACVAAVRAQDAAPAIDAQCPPEFEAETVSIEERGADVVIRRTVAQRARLWGDWLEAERVEVFVPASAPAGRPAWRCRADWLRRSLSTDVASFGPLRLQTADGAWLDAGGGAYDGDERTLVLTGPVHVRERRAHASATAAMVSFAAQSAEVEAVTLTGDVRGVWRLGGGQAPRPDEDDD